MSVNCLSMALDAREHSVKFWPRRAEEWACLAIEGDGMHCEIRLERAHVEAIRDYLPDVLAGLDRWAAGDVACERAEIASQRAADTTAKALDVAVAAEAAGAHDLVASLREASAKANATANAVDDTVRAFGNAADEADCATDSLIYVTRQAEIALRRMRDDDRPSELVNR